MSLLHVPVVDLSPYYSGDPEQKKRVAREIDEVCRDIGFLAVTGHQIDPRLIKAVQDVTVETVDSLLESPTSGNEGQGKGKNEGQTLVPSRRMGVVVETRFQIG